MAFLKRELAGPNLLCTATTRDSVADGSLGLSQ
jgi:hypothetical protein